MSKTSKYANFTRPCSFSNAPRWGPTKGDNLTSGPGQYNTATSSLKKRDLSFGKVYLHTDGDSDQHRSTEALLCVRAACCAQRAGGIAGRGVLGRREGGGADGAGDSAQRAARRE